jgi:hypothetical protein
VAYRATRREARGTQIPARAGRSPTCSPHWEPLTLFLRQPGAPLDNNIAERALKKAILYRKNAYFYKIQNGARVGDVFISLIHTPANLADPPAIRITVPALYRPFIPRGF